MSLITLKLHILVHMNGLNRRHLQKFGIGGAKSKRETDKFFINAVSFIQKFNLRC